MSAGRPAFLIPGRKQLMALNVGERVTIPPSTRVYVVEAVWDEKFPAFHEPQQVARIRRGAIVKTLRARHLKVEPAEGSKFQRFIQGKPIETLYHS